MWGSTQDRAIMVGRDMVRKASNVTSRNLNFVMWVLGVRNEF